MFLNRKGLEYKYNSQHPSKHFILARHRSNIWFYIGPLSAVDIGPMPDVQLHGGSRYCADIYRSSFFLAKTPFSWLLKPSANKIGKRKTGECINFNQFIDTNKFKATFEQFRRKNTYALYRTLFENADAGRKPVSYLNEGINLFKSH